MALVDLHLHLLPGVDDGPADVTEALRHAERLVADGVRKAVVTPHVGHPDFAVDPEDIPRRTHQLQQALDDAGVQLRIHPGGEIHASALSHLSHGALDAVAHGPAGARWVLVEAPFGAIGEDFLAGVERLRAMGFGALIAHPERSAAGQEHLPELMRTGALLQVSTCSLLGAHGSPARQRAIRMVADGSAYVLASDGHGGRRAQTLRLGRDLAVAAAGASRERAIRLTGANPRFLLERGLPPELSVPAASPSAFA